MPPDDDDALLAECSVETLRAGTRGGQRANKVETGVRLTHRPSGLVVTRRDRRSQRQNKQAALAELRRRLVRRATPETPRTATRPTPASKRRRLEAKRRQGERKAARRRPDPD
ncbi:MAG: peptide chain release factor-like protein [Rubricoccaceae bacterium]